MQDLMAISANKIAHIDYYEIFQTIGEGHIAEVKLAQHVLTRGEVSINAINKTNQSFSSLMELFSEVNSMRILNHPNIVKFLEVIDTGDSVYTIGVPQRGRCVHPLGGQRPQDGWGGPRPLPPGGLGSAALPQGGEVHWDLKLGNLLLDAKNNVKISDFGLSDQWPPGKKPDTICGPSSWPQNSSWGGLTQAQSWMCGTVAASYTPW